MPAPFPSTSSVFQTMIRAATLSFSAGLALFLGCAAVNLRAEAVPVTLGKDGSWQRGGQPYFIRGAGGSGPLEELKRRGGNSIRTWSDDGVGGPDGLLERAGKLGLSVCLGIWLEPECNWFSYRNPDDCEKQKQRVLKIIAEHRAHPALLCWGLGNEVEGDGGNAAFWHQLNRLALAAKAADPAHPTFTAVAGFSKEKIQAVNQWVPDLDFIGINTYAALGGLRDHLQKSGWTRPWVVTEFGPRGFWESPKTPWGAAREQTSTEKAVQIRDLYRRTISDSGGCGGSYAFAWSWKQEVTGTWFSLFSRSHETVTTVDVLEEMWTGQGPDNRTPELIKITCPRADAPMAPGTRFTAEVRAHDADADPLTYTWIVRAEATHTGNEGKDPEPPAQPAAILKADGASAEIAAPARPGAWRVFVEVRDGKGHLATANVPFLVTQP